MIFLGECLKAIILIIDWVARCSGISLPENHTSLSFWRAFVGHGFLVSAKWATNIAYGVVECCLLKLIGFTC